jgi:hypothetical protein
VTGPHQAPGRPERVDGSPIERYLDELLGRLRVDPARARRILAEAEDHLYATAEGLQGDGLSRSDAEQEAVRRFGEPAEVAASHRRIRLQDLPRPMIGLSGIGLVAIGVSGLFAEVMGRLWGAAFVAGDPPGSTYTPARCADFQEYFPGHDCLSAAALHHWGEVVEYRVAAGVLGLLLLLAYRFLPRGSRLPGGAVAALGAILFFAASAALSFDSLNLAVQGGHGVGASLSAATVASVVGVSMLVSAWREHRPARQGSRAT